MERTRVFILAYVLQFIDSIFEDDDDNTDSNMSCIKRIYMFIFFYWRFVNGLFEFLGGKRDSGCCLLHESMIRSLMKWNSLEDCVIFMMNHGHYYDTDSGLGIIKTRR